MVRDGVVTRGVRMRARLALGLAFAATGLLGLAAVTAPPAVVVEDWAGQAAGAHGIPAGWKSYGTPGGRPRYDFTVVEDEGRRALRLASRDEHSTIVKELHVDLATTPVLEWSWKVVKLPAGADIRARQTSDLTGHLLVVWSRVPAMLRSRLIGYGWDPVSPPWTIQKNRKTSLVTYVVVHSGTADLNRWLVDRRDVRADYRAVFGEDPDAPSALAISIDTNDTHAESEVLIGSIAFAPAAPGIAPAH